MFPATSGNEKKKISRIGSPLVKFFVIPNTS